MGEAKRRQLAVQTQALEAMVVDTPGGRIHVRWDHGGSATPNAQLTFFAEFLATTGVYDSWVNSCPLSYTSPNAHSKRDVLGTWLLAILAGLTASPRSPVNGKNHQRRRAASLAVAHERKIGRAH